MNQKCVRELLYDEESVSGRRVLFTRTAELAVNVRNWRREVAKVT
jgi:hypothetical protein